MQGALGFFCWIGLRGFRVLGLVSRVYGFGFWGGRGVGVGI